MENTQIVIELGEVIGIVIGLGVPIILGFLGVWRASASAHSKIIARLDRLEPNMTTVKTDVATLTTDVSTLKTDMAVAKNDLGWLKYFLRTGKPPPDNAP